MGEPADVGAIDPVRWNFCRICHDAQMNQASICAEQGVNVLRIYLSFSIHGLADFAQVLHAAHKLVKIA